MLKLQNCNKTWRVHRGRVAVVPHTPVRSLNVDPATPLTIDEQLALSIDNETEYTLPQVSKKRKLSGF